MSVGKIDRPLEDYPLYYLRLSAIGQCGVPGLGWCVFKVRHPEENHRLVASCTTREAAVAVVRLMRMTVAKLDREDHIRDWGPQ